MSPPKLFSKPTILVFSILGSTFFGALVYCSNLQALNKKQFIAPTIVFSIVFNVFAIWISKDLGYPLIKYFTINAIGGLVLIKAFWNYHLPDVKNNEPRKIWGPSIALSLPVILLFLLH